VSHTVCSLSCAAQKFPHPILNTYKTKYEATDKRIVSYEKHPDFIHVYFRHPNPLTKIMPNPTNPDVKDSRSTGPGLSLPGTTKKGKKGTAAPPESFKKIKGSNPQEVRQQFLQHSMKNSGSPNTNLNENTSGKLRPGKEILNRMKFDSSYDTGDYVVGYIDRKAGILEKSVDEWGEFGQEELMAYIKNVKDEEIIWDRARKIDMVFGKKGG